MGWLSETLFGGATETHEDGSTTERFQHGTTTSITRDADGSVKEHVKYESSIPVIGPLDVAVTRDGDGNIVNVQELKD